MKILNQIFTIFIICLLGEFLSGLLPIGIPSGILSMLLLYLLLLFRVVEESGIQEAADFLLKNMAFFFIPAGVNVMRYFDLLKNNLLPLVIICVVSTVLTFLGTVYTVEWVSKIVKNGGRQRRKDR